MRARLVDASFVLGLPLAAQTFVVDAAGGTGAHFTDLPPAVAVVPEGAVLLVRAGSYSGFTVDGTSLSVLGDDAAGPLVVVTGYSQVSNLHSQQSVKLRTLGGTPLSVIVSDGDGEVVQFVRGSVRLGYSVNPIVDGTVVNRARPTLDEQGRAGRTGAARDHDRMAGCRRHRYRRTRRDQSATTLVF